MKKISVVMPVHNCERYIHASLQSIVGQTLNNLEIILIDDASNDKTLSIIESFRDKRISIIRNIRRKGVTKSLNIGLKHAKGEYIARMDGDDIAMKNRFKEQAQYLDVHPDTALVGTWVDVINEKGKIIDQKKMPSSYKDICQNIMKYNPFIHSTVMFRKSVLMTVGTYENSLNGAEDYDLFLRIAKRYKVLNIPKKLHYYRIHKANITLSSLKKVEGAALKARIRALTIYGYPQYTLIYLIKPFFSYLIPAKIKASYFKR